MSRFITVIIPIFLLMFVGCMPVSSATGGITYQGTVAGIDQTAGSLSINTTAGVYVIYPLGLKPEKVYSPRSAPIILKKSVPDRKIFGLVKIGDAVRTTTPSNEDTNWSSVAGIPHENRISEPILWLVGEPDPLLYAITTAPTVKPGITTMQPPPISTRPPVTSPTPKASLPLIISGMAILAALIIIWRRR